MAPSPTARASSTTPLTDRPEIEDAVPTAEARFRRTFNLVLVAAVLVDLLAQATHLVPSGSLPLLAILVALALPAAVLFARSAHAVNGR